MNRHHGAEAYAGLKAATRLAVRDSGGVDAFAAATRGTAGMASAYGSVAAPDRYMPIDIAIDADALAGTPHITGAMARALGYLLVPVAPRHGGELAAAMARIGAGTGKLFATMADAFADGVVTEQERIALARDMDDLLRVATEARQVLQRLPAPPIEPTQED